MSEVKTFSAGHIQCYCDDNGKAHCAVCDRVLEPDQMAMLLRLDHDGLMDPWCFDCALPLIRQCALQYAVRLLR